MDDPTQTAPTDNSQPANSDLLAGLAMTGGGSGHPEVKNFQGPEPLQPPEIEIIPESPEVSPELAEHVEKVIRGEIQLPGPIEVGKHQGQTVTISPSAPQQPNIVLPVTQDDFKKGFSQPVASAWRWLVEWVKRIILKNPGRVVYRT